MDKRKTETEKQYKSDLRSWETLRADNSDQLPKNGAFIVGGKEPLLKHTHISFNQQKQMDNSWKSQERYDHPLKK